MGGRCGSGSSTRPWRFRSDRSGGREGPGAVQDLLAGAVEPDHVVPALGDGEDVDVLVARGAAELDGDGAVGGPLGAEVVEGVDPLSVLLEVPVAVVHAD